MAIFEACPKCGGRKTIGEACYCGAPDKAKKAKKKPAAKKKPSRKKA